MVRDREPEGVTGEDLSNRDRIDLSGAELSGATDLEPGIGRILERLARSEVRRLSPNELSGRQARRVSKAISLEFGVDLSSDTIRTFESADALTAAVDAALSEDSGEAVPDKANSGGISTSHARLAVILVWAAAAVFRYSDDLCEFLSTAPSSPDSSGDSVAEVHQDSISGVARALDEFGLELSETPELRLELSPYSINDSSMVQLLSFLGIENPRLLSAMHYGRGLADGETELFGTEYGPFRVEVYSPIGSGESDPVIIISAEKAGTNTPLRIAIPLQRNPDLVIPDPLYVSIPLEVPG